MKSTKKGSIDLLSLCKESVGVLAFLLKTAVLNCLCLLNVSTHFLRMYSMIVSNSCDKNNFLERV